MNTQLIDLCKKASPEILVKISIGFHALDTIGIDNWETYPIDELWRAITIVMQSLPDDEKDHPCFEPLKPGEDVPLSDRDCQGDGWYRCKECRKLVDG